MTAPAVVAAVIEQHGQDDQESLISGVSTAGTAHLIVFCGNTLDYTVATPAGSTTVIPATLIESGLLDGIGCRVYARPADTDEYFVGVAAPEVTWNVAILTIDHAGDVDDWVVGDLVARDVNATPDTCVAEGVTTVDDMSLVLTLSFECSADDEETGAPTVSNGAEEVWVGGPTYDLIPQTMLITSELAPTAGLTDDVTITYEHAAANRGAAVQIAIPPA